MTLGVQHPTIYTHVYWCVSAPRRGRGTESGVSLSSIPQPDVFRRIVVRVNLVAALLAVEVFAVAVVAVCEPAVRPRTALGRVVRRNLLHRDAAFRGLVLDVLEQTTERSDVVPLRVREALANIGQLFKHDYVTVVFDGFCDDFVGDGVDVPLSPRFFALAEAEERVVSGLGAALLHLTTSLLELTAPVVVVIALPERAGRSDREAVNTEIDTEDCLVLSICRNLGLLIGVVFPRCGVEVELVGRLVVL